MPLENEQRFISNEGRQLAPGFDPELFLLEKGIKKAVKKEGVRAASLDEIIRGFRERGLHVVEDPGHYFVDADGNYVFDGTGRDERATLIVGRDEADANRAFKFHIDEDYDTAPGKNASRELGGMLGYPVCCTDFFLKLEDNTDDERNVVKTLLNTRGRLDPLANVTTSCELISHVCCGFDCKYTIKIARTVLNEIRKSYGSSVADEIMRINSLKTIFLAGGGRIRLDGRAAGGRCHYENVYGRAGKIARLLKDGNSCRFHDNQLRVYKNEKLLHQVEIDGFYFNWGGRNIYDSRAAGRK